MGRYVTDETGNVYGRLTVIEQAEERANGMVQWVCQCECGNETAVRGTRLRSGETQSCGCLRDESGINNLPQNRLPRGEAAFNHLLNAYQQAAKKRGLSWEISDETFRSLTRQHCHYCGAKPARVYSVKRLNGTYTYNGVDRKDNNVGYTPENVVSCCARCNRWKGAMGYDDFLERASKIAAHCCGIR